MTKGQLAKPLLLGVTAGMRSQAPLALLAIAANRGRFLAGAGRPWGLLRSRDALMVTSLLAAGELVADKLPFTPSRLEPGPLAGRLALGGVAGAVAARAGRGRVPVGVAAGGLGAWVGARAGYRARASLGRRSTVPDPVWGVIEDVLTVWIGVVALGGSHDPHDGSIAARTR